MNYHLWIFLAPPPPQIEQNKKQVKASRYQDLIRIFCPEFFWAKSGKCESIFRFYTLSEMWFIKILKFGPLVSILNEIYQLRIFFTDIFRPSLESYFPPCWYIWLPHFAICFRLWKLTGVFFGIICWVISSNHIPLYQLTHSFKCTYYKYL